MQQQYVANLSANESRSMHSVNVSMAPVPTVASFPTMKRRQRIYRGVTNVVRPAIMAMFGLWALLSAIPLKVVILFLLVFQNCAAVAFLRFTRTRVDLPLIPITTVVALQEGTKFFLSMLWSFAEFAYFSAGAPLESSSACGAATNRQAGEPSLLKTVDTSDIDDGTKSHCSLGEQETASELSCGEEYASVRVGPSVPAKSFSERLIQEWLKGKLLQSSGWLMCIPAALFTIQNCLLFVALENLEPTLFQVTYQSRLLVAAVMMKVFLHRTFSFQKWLAMGLLICGIVLTQSRTSSSSQGATVTVGKAAEAIATEEVAVGLLAVFVCCVSSSAAGVAMEKMFKEGTAIALSTRNVHLSLFSIAFALISKVATEWWRSAEDFAMKNGENGNGGGSVFDGVDAVVAMMILNQAAGGVLVALVLKYADNVLKSFATTIAIVVSGVTSHFLFGFEPSGMFLIGATIVIIATLVYGSPDQC